MQIISYNKNQILFKGNTFGTLEQNARKLRESLGLKSDASMQEVSEALREDIIIKGLVLDESLYNYIFS